MSVSYFVVCFAKTCEKPAKYELQKEYIAGHRINNVTKLFMDGNTVHKHVVEVPDLETYNLLFTILTCRIFGLTTFSQMCVHI